MRKARKDHYKAVEWAGLTLDAVTGASLKYVKGGRIEDRSFGAAEDVRHHGLAKGSRIQRKEEMKLGMTRKKIRSGAEVLRSLRRAWVGERGGKLSLAVARREGVEGAAA